MLSSYSFSILLKSSFRNYLVRTHEFTQLIETVREYDSSRDFTGDVNVWDDFRNQV